MVGFSANQKTAWSRSAHICANFAVQYGLGSAAVAMAIMSTSYCTTTEELCMRGKQQSWVTGTLNGITLLGAMIGQLSMGTVGDILGRSNALLFTMALATLGNALSAIIPHGDADMVYIVIIIFRFFAGIGLGGVFPLSATKAAEDDGSADGHSVDPRAAATAFFWQMPGMMGPSAIGLIVSNINMTMDSKWRLVLGFGAALTGLATFNLGSSVSSDKTDSIMTTLKSEYRTDPKFIKRFAATGGCWLLFDIIVYGIGLFLPQIVHSISPDFADISSPEALRSTFSKILVYQAIALPATALVILTMPFVTLRSLQCFGFVILAAGLAIFDTGYHLLYPDSPQSTFAVLCVLGFTMQCGVNVTSFVLPGALFRREVRSTCNGVAAAIGKIGAVIGAYLFPVVRNHSTQWVNIVLSINIAVSLLGALVTYWNLENDMVNDGAKMNLTETLGSNESNLSSRVSSREPSAMKNSISTTPSQMFSQSLSKTRKNMADTKDSNSNVELGNRSSRSTTSKPSPMGTPDSRGDVLREAINPIANIVNPIAINTNTNV
eukprot:GSChrysophyteH1.ASY1.ANO1.3081.1 assembled CDS